MQNRWLFLGILLALGAATSPSVIARQGVSPAVAGTTAPDDSPASRDAAIARLRAATPTEVCGDASKMSRVYGTTCASREFPAPPLLAAPTIAWETKPGWWGAWSPFLVGDLVLTGSCNNDGGEGVSALDMKTGQVRWRISDICRVGSRRGSMGVVSFFELPSGEVLLIYPRENGKPTDYYVIDVKAGRIVRSLKPLRQGPTQEAEGTFIIVTQSTAANSSYINAFSADMARLLWQNDGFRLAMTDNLDPRYRPTLSAPAASGGILYRTARSKDQPEPPTRQLHAIDMQTGKTLWRHTNQPPVERSGSNTIYRSDDELPMVAGGHAIIKVYGLLGVVGSGRTPNGESLRALDARTGEMRWTTAAIAGQVIINRVAAGRILVTEVQQGDARQLWGYRLADGALAWRRPVPKGTRLLASSGGVFYVSERVGDDFRLQGLDGDTGTLLWTTRIPGHNLLLDEQWGIQDARSGTTAQGPSWRIGRDGAIYGVTLTGAFKLQ
ncbi:MAG: PQQ-binding-like beta-propeller repeat protein [Acidobacteria bacterium]|nr:PQQ-binding-like beta-propeller repeat protein [Acidobacteriota bacterium]